MVEVQVVMQLSEFYRMPLFFRTDKSYSVYVGCRSPAVPQLCFKLWNSEQQKEYWLPCSVQRRCKYLCCNFCRYFMSVSIERLLYVGESKIIRTIGTCFAVGYTAGWAWKNTHGLLLSYHCGAGVTLIVHFCHEFFAVNMDTPNFICTKEEQRAVIHFCGLKVYQVSKCIEWCQCSMGTVSCHNGLMSCHNG